MSTPSEAEFAHPVVESKDRGGALVTWVFTFTATAYKVLRQRRSLEATA